MNPLVWFYGFQAALIAGLAFMCPSDAGFFAFVALVELGCAFYEGAKR